MSAIIEPRHKLSKSKKTLKGYFKPTIDYYIRHSTTYSGYKTTLQVLYDAAEGIINKETYKYVLNPVNTSNEQFKRLPARLRNYDIISPVINRFLGEYAKTPDNITVYSTGSESISDFTDARNRAMDALLAQDFINHLNRMGVETGVESQEVPDYRTFYNEFDLNYTDRRAVYGEQALRYLKKNLDMDERLQEMLYDWLVVGYVITYKELSNNDVDYVVCDPRDVDVFGIGPGEFVEDAEAIVYIRRWTKSQIYDLYDLKDEEIDTLEELQHSHVPHDYINMHTPNIDRVEAERDGSTDYSTIIQDDKYLVYTVVWRGLEKVGELTYIDQETLQLTAMEVDEDYVLRPEEGDINIDWDWKEVWYEGHRIEDKFYKRIKRGEVQRNEINERAGCKLPFNGRWRGYRNTELVSTVKQGLNYQVLVNIFHFRMEFMVAKAKDKMTAFPIGLIPKKYGWDDEKWFYWSNVHGFMMYDETAPNAQVALQGIKQIDMSLNQYIATMYDLIDRTRESYWNEVGMNRHRYGDILTSDGKGNTDQAIFRSAVSTLDMYRQLDKLVEKDCEGLIDYAKIAWKDGKKGFYVTSQGQRRFFEIDGDDFIGTDYGVFVKVSQQEREKLEQAKALMQTMGQNGLGPDGMMRLLDADSMATVKGLAKQALEAERTFQAQLQNQKIQSDQAIAQQESADKAMDSEDKRYVAYMNYLADIETATIKANADLTKMQMQGISDLSDFETDDDDNGRNDFDRRNLAREQLALKYDQVAAKYAEMANKLKIAKENKNRYDVKSNGKK